MTRRRRCSTASSTATAASLSTLTAPPSAVTEVSLATPRLSRRWLAGTFAAALVLCFAQSPGMISPDTKLDLTANPLGFLARAAHLWTPNAPMGQVQNQAYGYFFPHGAFFALGDLLAVPPWIVQRLWWAVLLTVGSHLGHDYLGRLEQVAPAMEKLRASGKTRFIGFSGVGEPAALLRAVESGLFDTVQVVYNALNPSAGGPMPAGAPGLDYGRLLDRAKAADMGTIVIRALAGGALSGTIDRHPLAMQDVAPIGSAPDFAADVARARQLEPLVRDGVAGSLTELGERFVISHPAVSTMLIGYSTLDHLDAAIAAVGKGPLPDAALKRLG